MNIHEIAGAIYCAVSTARDYIEYLHCHAKMIHIVDWEKRTVGQSRVIPRYLWGEGIDKPRPAYKEVKSKTQSERWLRIRDDVLAKRKEKRAQKIRAPEIPLSKAIQSACDLIDEGKGNPVALFFRAGKVVGEFNTKRMFMGKSRLRPKHLVGVYTDQVDARVLRADLQEFYKAAA
jgi:hypothetical protein